MPRKKTSNYPEQMPPPTAHRLAAWLSLAKSLSLADFKSIRFQPTPDDIQVLRNVWQRRLVDLRDNGLDDLKKSASFDAAMQCQAHILAYAGEGRPCRLRFCPFCSAQEAAFLYERVRRFIEHIPEAGLILGTRKLRIARGELSNPFELMKECDDPTTDTYVKNLIVTGGGLGTIVRFSYLPHSNRNFDDKAVLVARVLAGVTTEESKNIAKARKGGETAPGCRDAYSVPLKKVTLARAVAHLCAYPEHIFTSPTADVSKMLNETAGIRLSIIRGGFRSPMPNNPRLFPIELVPKRRGFGIATEIFGGYTEATEAIAAREFAAAFGLEQVDSFAALSQQIGLPIHWIGRTPPIPSLNDLHRWKSNAPLYDFLMASPFLRGRGPFSHRVLVCSIPTWGIYFIVTCDGERISLDSIPKPLLKQFVHWTFGIKNQFFWMIRLTQLPGWQILLPRSPDAEPPST